ncbi:MAG: hypothetical protein AAFN77_10540 [Planctomycetota bacterium]
MLASRFTIRQMLIAVVAVSLIAVCLASAQRGSLIAHGLVWGMVLFLVPVCTLVVMYWLAALVFLIVEREPKKRQVRVNPAMPAAKSSSVNVTDDSSTMEDA